MSLALQKKLGSKCKTFYTQHKDVLLDIFLFGSSVRGKRTPDDVDILVVFKEKRDRQLAYTLRKELEALVDLPVSVTVKTYADLFSKNFSARESLLTEAYSLVRSCGFSSGLGFSTRVLFLYELKGKSKSERMRFYYSLYGRNSEGMLSLLGAVKYADRLILCPVASQDKMRAYLISWQLDFREIPLLIPSRLL